MSQSAIQQKITAIRVKWTLQWAERNAALVRYGGETLMRQKQQDDWENSQVKAIIDKYSDDIEALTAVETTIRLSPDLLDGSVNDDTDWRFSDEDEYESDYGETDTEEEDEEPRPKKRSRVAAGMDMDE